MARNQVDGWRLAGQLLGFGIAAGAAYLVHTKMEEFVDLLLQKPSEQAFRELAGAVPGAEDEVWHFLHNALSRRAATSRRATELLVVAEEARRMGPSLLRMIRFSPDVGYQTMGRLASDLDVEEWNMLCLVLAGLADHEPQAGNLLRAGFQYRAERDRLIEEKLRASKRAKQAVVTQRNRQLQAKQDPSLNKVDSLLKLAPQERSIEIAVLAHSLTDDEWKRLLQAIGNRAKTTPEANHLMTLAEKMPAAVELATTLIAMSSEQAEQQMLTRAAEMSEDDWTALDAVVSKASSENDEAFEILNKVRAVRESFYALQEFLQLSQERAESKIQQIANTASQSEWLRMSALLAQKASTNRLARVLVHKVEQIERSRQPVVVEELTPEVTAASLSDTTSDQQDSAASIVPRLQPESLATGADMLRQSLRMALADRVITPDEAAILEELRRKLNISDDLARSIFQEIRAEVV